MSLRAGLRESLRPWAELLRVSALFTVPGDALAGAAALGVRPNRSTALAVGASLCLYEAGMALNDWADREEDAIDRPHRPIPSGRISPRAALAAAGGLTAAGLALAAGAGRPALAVGTALAATVWAYDTRLKHTPAGPLAMGAARTLDLLLGATATARGAGAMGGGSGRAPSRTATPAAPVVHGTGSRDPWGGARAALPSAALLGAHTVAVTTVSRRETQGGSTAAPLAALAATAALGLLAGRTTTPVPAPAGTQPPSAPASAAPGRFAGAPGRGTRAHRTEPAALVAGALAAVYVGTAGRPLLHAVLNPSPPLTQRAVGGGIRAMIPLQAALAARGGAAGVAAGVMALVPLARTLARKVSPT
ncbi:SCO3242 family prenyltransferase [Streptomyces sp. NPDC051569]|uniref:SCO3242 family prenyltransferase n=1 Tax=Streptomyces sp. NPDC051569 TaxID=3365661 RepID=UPI00379FD322